VLTDDVRRFERIMLEVRLAEGLDVALLSPAGRAAAERLARAGALELSRGARRLTLHGRLTADAVVRDLTD
jgi:oxygen-independent coproporphyrinogen-3 oxidase